MTQTGEVVDGFASVFSNVCVCVCVAAAGCCGLAQKGSPDVGEKCKVSCRWKKKSKELEDKPNTVYLRLHFFFFHSGICKERPHKAALPVCGLLHRLHRESLVILWLEMKII